MRYIIYILIVIISSNSYLSAFADKDLWIFGNGASLKFDSPNPNPYALSDDFLINSIEASATGFDQNGNLLFYSDGEKIWNFKHEVIFDELKGAKDATQGVTIFRSDSNDKNFFLVSSNIVNQFDEGAYLYKLSFNNNPDGEVNPNPQFLDSSKNCFERVVVLPSSRDDEKWIIVNPRNVRGTSYIIYSFKDGVATFKERYNSPTHRNSSSGYLRASPDGRFLASADFDGNEVEIVEFDIDKGIILSQKSYKGNELEYGVYGLEFSRNSKFLYLTTWEPINASRYYSRCLQLDINPFLYNNSINLYEVHELAHDVDDGGMWSLKRGIDSKIYISREERSYLSVINNPNSSGSACNFQELGPSITTNNDKSRIGLPSTATNIYEYEYDIIDINICDSSILYYYPEFDLDYNDYSWVGNLREFKTRALLIGSVEPNDSGVYYLTNKSTNKIIIGVRVNVGLPKIIRFKQVPLKVTCDVDSVIISVEDEYDEYLWTGGSTEKSISLKSSGRYYLNAVDEFGCELLDSIDLYFTPPPDFEIEVEILDCKDEFRLTCTGDFDNYLWSNGKKTKSIDIDRSGTYSLKVENSKDCFTVKEIKVESVYKEVNVSFPAGYFICTDEIIVAEISNPNPKLVYKWSNGYKTLKTAFQKAGKYYVEATDTTTGCVFKKEFNIYSADDFELEIIPNYDCQTGEIVLTTNAENSGFKYIWSNGLTTESIEAFPLETYSVKIISQEQKCDFYDTLYVEELIIYDPKLSFPEGISICKDDTIAVNVKNPNDRFEYFWSNGNSRTDISISSAGNYTLNARDKITKCEFYEFFEIYDLTNFKLQISQDYDCNNSSFLLTSNANTDLLNLKWSNGSSNKNINVSEEGFYFLEASNSSGCFFYDTLLVEQVRSFDLNILSFPRDTVCSISEVVLRIENKSPKMKSHKWSTGSKEDSIIVTKSGTYILEGKDEDQCTIRDTAFVLITTPPEFTISSSRGDTICENESSILSVTGLDNLSNYDYQWSNGSNNPSISVNLAGDYILLVSVKGTLCSDTSIFRLRIKPSPELELSGKTEFCEGGNTTIKAEYKNGTISWDIGLTSDSIIVDKSGTYIATVDNGLGCLVSDTINITVNEASQFNIIGKNKICYGDTISLSSDTEFDSYLWSTGDLTKTITVTTAGTYTLDVINNNGCESSSTYVINEANGTYYISDIISISDSLMINDEIYFKFTIHNLSQLNQEFTIDYSNISEIIKINANSQFEYKLNSTLAKLGPNEITFSISSAGNCKGDTSITYLFDVYTILKAELPVEFYKYINFKYNYPVRLTTVTPLDLKLTFDLFVPNTIFYPTQKINYEEDVSFINELIVEFEGITLYGAPFIQNTYFNSIETDNPYVIIDTTIGSIEVGRICLGDKALIDFKFFPTVAVYPNPISDYLTIELLDYDSRNIELTIISETGQLVLNKNILVSGQTKVEMNELANGSYTLILKSELWEESYRFNKVE